MISSVEGADPAYPTFAEHQLAVLASYGSRSEVSAGEVVYSPADESNDLIVVLAGEIAVRDESQGRDVAFARFGPGTFVGELNLLTGQRPFVTARASVAGAVVRIPAERLRVLLERETDVADLLVTAMVARRRLRLADSAERSAIEVIGASMSERTLALRTFLSRNTVPYRFTEFDVRRDTLTETMSQYLVDRIAAHGSIDVASSTVIGAVGGGDHLETVELHDNGLGTTRRIEARGLFCLIGARPGTAWLPDRVRRDEDGSRSPPPRCSRWRTTSPSSVWTASATWPRWRPPARSRTPC